MAKSVGDWKNDVYAKISVDGVKVRKFGSTNRKVRLTFSQYLSPTNLDENRKPKTVERIIEEIIAARDKWLEENLE